MHIPPDLQELGVDPATHVPRFCDFDIFETFNLLKAHSTPPHRLLPSKTALTTAPTLTGDSQRCILIVLKLPAHAQWQHWQRSRCSRLSDLLSYLISYLIQVA